jgi:16S rRNA A1518/A1519 N6-dimethyltransferase RsmA/KsgA/DIM1 with predicted DNA glycosylase/AP lyase activity
VGKGVLPNELGHGQGELTEALLEEVSYETGTQIDQDAVGE